MLNSLERSNEFMSLAQDIVDRCEKDRDGKHHGIMMRSYGYQYWKFFKKAKADEYLNKALAIFEKVKSPYLVSTIYKEKGDMHKELQEAEQAQNCYEQCIRLRRQAFGEGNHFCIEKIFFRLADNMLKERCNDAKLRKAGAYLQRDHEMLLDILEIESEEEELQSKSLFLAMHYQFKGKLSARHIDKEGCIANYKRSEEIFIRSYNGERALVMQSFYQFIVDDLSELAMEEEAMRYNKLYKQTLRQFYEKDDLFFIAYTVDIVAQEMQTKPMKAFYKVKRAQAVIEPVIGKDSLIGLIFQLFEGLKDMFNKET
jgi:tetratricopeptide (TPR) repeat protein